VAADRGAEELRELGRALKTLGDREFRKTTLRAIKAPAKRLGEEAKANAPAVLPNSGGLGDYIASTRVSVQARLSGENAQVRIRGVRRKDGGMVDLDRIDRGRLRHPLFGNRKHWYTQDVPAGWWTDAMLRRADEVRREVMDVVHDAIKRAVR
jgi:hypothetical protein